MGVGPHDLEGPHWTLLLDREITRRKIYHQVVNPRGLLMYSSRTVSACIDYLEAEGVSAYEVRLSPHRNDPGGTIWVDVKRTY